MMSMLRYLFILEDSETSANLKAKLSREMHEMDSGVEYDFYEAAGPEDALRQGHRHLLRLLWRRRLDSRCRSRPHGLRRRKVSRCL